MTGSSGNTDDQTSVRTDPNREDEVLVESYKIEDQPISPDDSVSSKANQSAQTLKELINTIGKKVKTAAQDKSQQLKEAAADEKPALTEDSAEIHRLGDLLDNLLENFDETLDDIRKSPYKEQEKLLLGYKKLLAEELNVINARLELAKRLQPAEKVSDRAEANVESTRPKTTSTA